MKFKLWLMFLHISNKNKLDLLERYKNEEDVYNNFESWSKEKKEFTKKFVNFNKKFSLNFVEEKRQWMEEENIGFINILDLAYPQCLKEIEEPPYGFFYKGNIDILNSKIVSIVGSRGCTNYGIQVTKLLTKELISYNITIISGGARGIDSVAHKEVIESNGNTIVVLGSGIDITYPKENKNLFDKVILNNGLIISEFLLGTAPLSYNFPRRNRIISALSELVIVVEASSKSGSLITASHAAEQGKTVLAVPGSVFSKGSNGCNKLIRDGAQVFTSLEDLYTLLNLSAKDKSRIISPMKKKILSIIEDEPKHIDYIMNKSYIDREALYKVLFEMQIGNEIVSLPGNYYAKIT